MYGKCGIARAVAKGIGYRGRSRSNVRAKIKEKQQKRQEKQTITGEAKMERYSTRTIDEMGRFVLHRELIKKLGIEMGDSVSLLPYRHHNNLTTSRCTFSSRFFYWPHKRNWSSVTTKPTNGDVWLGNKKRISHIPHRQHDYFKVCVIIKQSSR